MTPLETYLRDLREIRSTGAGVEEESYYRPLATLLNEIGKRLKPKGGAIEIKPTKNDAWATAETKQVTRYWNKYRQALVTNNRHRYRRLAAGSGSPRREEAA